MSSNTLSLKNSAGTVLSSVNLSAYAVADQFVDTVTLATSNGTTTGTYIKITFKQSGKDPIYVDVKSIWDLSAKGITITSAYTKATESVAAGDSLEVAIGKVEGQVVGANNAAANAKSAADSKIASVTGNSYITATTSSAKAVTLGANVANTAALITSATSSTNKLATDYAVQQFVTGKGYVTSSGSVASATTATTATTATNLASAPSLASSGNTITVTAGGKTSTAFTVPYAASANTASSATSATKATQDGSGNTISSTYITATTLATTTYTVTDIDSVLSA